eukprot:10052-Heterococcus_DN1.PRE.3
MLAVSLLNQLANERPHTFAAASASTVGSGSALKPALHLGALVIAAVMLSASSPATALYTGAACQVLLA